MKGFTLGLVMKMRVFGTLKWCILSQLLGNLTGEKCVFQSAFFFFHQRILFSVDFHTNAVPRQGERVLRTISSLMIQVDYVNVIAAFPKILIRNCELHFQQNYNLQAETFQFICSLTKIGFLLPAEMIRIDHQKHL